MQADKFDGFLETYSCLLLRAITIPVVFQSQGVSCRFAEAEEPDIHRLDARAAILGSEQSVGHLVSLSCHVGNRTYN